MQFKKVKKLHTFELQKFILDIMESYSSVLKMLLPTFSKRLCKTLFNFITRTYLLMIIALSTQYSPKETKSLVEKLRVDKQLLRELFAGQVSAREIEERYKILDTLEHCLTDHIEEVIAYLVPLAAALGEDFNDNCVVSHQVTRLQSLD